MERYIVTDPIPNGYDWFDVVDTKGRMVRDYAGNPHYANKTVASFERELPEARREAHYLAERLNEHSDRMYALEEEQCPNPQA